MMIMSSIKLKTGWRATAHPSVFENKNGERIHTMGMLRDAHGNANPPSQDELFTYLMLTGGNMRRSLMACMECAGSQ